MALRDSLGLRQRQLFGRCAAGRQLKLKKQLSAGIIRRLLAESSFVADANP